jgi:hypothetical protein
MSKNSTPDLPKYFQVTSDLPYDRHHYKVVHSNGNTTVVDSWESAQMLWFQAPSQFMSHIEVLDVGKNKKKKGFGKN